MEPYLPSPNPLLVGGKECRALRHGNPTEGPGIQLREDGGLGGPPLAPIGLKATPTIHRGAEKPIPSKNDSRVQNSLSMEGTGG